MRCRRPQNQMRHFYRHLAISVVFRGPPLTQSMTGWGSLEKSPSHPLALRCDERGHWAAGIFVGGLMRDDSQKNSPLQIRPSLRGGRPRRVQKPKPRVFRSLEMTVVPAGAKLNSRWNCLGKQPTVYAYPSAPMAATVDQDTTGGLPCHLDCSGRLLAALSSRLTIVVVQHSA